MIELMVDGFKSFAPFQDCGQRNPVQESDWGTISRLASTDEVLKFGYQEEQDGASRLYGYYVANKREGVWLSCTTHGESNESLRTRYIGGIEVGPREYFTGQSLYKSELLRNGKVIARILARPTGGISVSEIDRDRESGLAMSRLTNGTVRLETNTAGTRNGLRIDAFGRHGVDIGIVERGEVVQSLPANDFSRLLTETAGTLPIGYKAIVEPYFTGVFRAPYPGTFNNRMSAPVLDELLDIKGRVRWNTASERAPFDLLASEGRLNLTVSNQSTVVPLSAPSSACLPDAAIRSNPDNLFLVPAAIQMLDLYTPDGLFAFKRELDSGLTESSIQILRWSHLYALHQTDEDIRSRAADDFPKLSDAITSVWNTTPCRRALLYWGDFRPIYPQLRRNNVVSPVLIRALLTGKPSPEERALSQILRRNRGLTQTDQQVFDWLRDCVGQDGVHCDGNMTAPFEEFAWVQAKEVGMSDEFRGFIRYHMDRVSIGVAAELLASLWIDEFHQRYASMLRKPGPERIAFVEKMQSDIIAASNWAGRMQVLLLWPWSSLIYKEPRDYESYLNILMHHPSSPAPGSSDWEQAQARKWYDDEKAIAEAVPVMVQSDFVTASEATDMVLDYLQAIIAATDSEVGDSAPDEAAINARILSSGLPDETIEIQDQFLPSGMTVATSDPLFSYTSDDYFKISFTVPKGSASVTQISGSPIAVALLPTDGLDPNLLVCGDEHDTRCGEPSAEQTQLMLARLVLLGTVEVRTVQPDGSVFLSVVVNCSTKCRTIKGKGMFEPPPPALEPFSSALADDGLLDFIGSVQLNGSGEIMRLSGNLLKSSGPWIAVPLLVGGASYGNGN